MLQQDGPIESIGRWLSSGLSGNANGQEMSYLESQGRQEQSVALENLRLLGAAA